ncbi:B12-binding domain-containing radical SAM protein [Actinomadura luteofluorescens]
MKVLLVEPPIMDYRGGGRRTGELRSIAMDAVRECPPYGIYLLASVLRAAGHEVVLADLIAAADHRLTAWAADLENCDLVGIGATSMSWPTARVVIQEIRRDRPDVPIVLGGIHPTMFDEYILGAFPVDYVIRGEAETGLPALCAAISEGTGLDGVPNLSRREADGTIRRNALAPKMEAERLAEFPVPDYAEVPAGVYKGLAIESSRGCAFDCSFCSTSYRRTWRGLRPEAFVDRLEAVLPHLDRTLYRTVHIIDDEFSMNPRRATAIAEAIARRGLSPLLVYDSRATDLLYEPYVPAIAPFTCQFLIGAECGYDEGLKLVGKGTTCDILERAARRLQEFGISDRADFSFILGLPWETKAEVEKTIRFAVRLHALYGVRILLQWYCQIPGSRLWQADRARGVVNETMYDEFGFFRDLYLFRSGVRLTPEEIWEIGDLVEQLKAVALIRTPGRRMIEFAFPQAIHDFYPRTVLRRPGTGLRGLREVARAPKPLRASDLPPEATAPAPAPDAERTGPVHVGIPQRHFIGTDDDPVLAGSDWGPDSLMR